MNASPSRVDLRRQNKSIDRTSTLGNDAHIPEKHTKLYQLSSQQRLLQCDAGSNIFYSVSDVYLDLHYWQREQLKASRAKWLGAKIAPRNSKCRQLLAKTFYVAGGVFN